MEKAKSTTESPGHSSLQSFFYIHHSPQIIIDGQNVLGMNQNELREFRKQKASMVFQKFALLPHYTVADNVAFGLTIQNVPKNEALERSSKWVERVGLAGYERHFPDQLSGGMQQRVGLAPVSYTHLTLPTKA